MKLSKMENKPSYFFNSGMKKRNREKKRTYEFILLPCGDWVTEPLDDKYYNLHCLTCMLCKDIKFARIFDLRYDVLLPCGTRGIHRTLTREEYVMHQRRCRDCELIAFDQLQSFLENMHDFYNTTCIDVEKCDEKIHQLKTMLKIHKNTLFDVSSLTSRCGNQIQDLMNECSNDELYSGLTMNNMLTSLLISRDELDECSEKLLQTHEELGLATQTKKRLFSAKLQIQLDICHFGDRIKQCLFFDSIYEDSKYLFGYNFKSQDYNFMLGKSENTSLLSRFTVCEPIKGRYIVSWETKKDQQTKYQVTDLVSTLWKCFFRCLLLVSEEQYHDETKGCTLKYFPNVVCDHIAEFVGFSCFQLLDCWHFFALRLFTTVKTDVLIQQEMNKFVREFIDLSQQQSLTDIKQSVRLGMMPQSSHPIQSQELIL